MFSRRLFGLAALFLFAVSPVAAQAQTGPSFADGASVATQIYPPGMAISTLTLPAATGGSGTLSYTLSGGLPSGLTFSASARTVTGTPTAGAVKADLTYTVTDTASMTDTLSVTIIVRPGITITQAAGSITNQFSNSHTVVLDAAPASDVTLALTQRFNFVENPPAGYAFDQSSLTFTSANWNTPQTVNWSATQGLNAGAVYFTYAISIGGTQTHTRTFFFHVIVAEELVVSPTTLTMAEGGTATYTVVFANLQPQDTGTAVVTPVSSDTAIATVSGPLSFTRGSSGNWATAQTVTITALTIGDADTDSDSVTITHTITGQSVDAAFRGSVTVTVIDADSLRQLAIGVDESMRDEGETAVFTITLSGMAPASGTPVTVDWAVSGNVASGDSGDYSITGADTDGTLSFTALGSQTLSVAITDDATSEGEETLTITLSNAAAADIATAAATTNIHESDRPLTMQARPQSRSVGDAANLTEGTAVTFIVESVASTITTAPIEVDWTITFPAASATVNPASNADFQTRTGTVTIAIQPTSGVPQGGASITAIADGLNEPMENFVFTISNPRGGGPRVTPILSSDVSVNGTIAASDPVTASIAGPTPATAREGESVTFTITLSSASTAAVTVPWSVNELSDANLIATTSGTLTFAALTTTLSQDIVIPIGESETLTSASPTETLTATIGTLSGGHGALSGGGSTTDVTVSFTSADHTIAFTNPATAVAEGDTVTYTVTRSGPALAGGASVAIRWTYTAGTAAAADFTTAPAGGMLTFSGSDTVRTFSVAIADDTASEAAETFTLGLTADAGVLASNGGVALGGDVTVTIGESDRPVTVSIAAPTGELSEGTAADFEVSISGGVTTTEPMTADWTVTFGTATTADFTAANRSGTATIAAGMSSVNVPITATADSLNEGAETFTVTLSNPAGGGAIAALSLHNTNNAADASVAASDPITAAITAPAAANEGESIDFAVNLGVASVADVTVTYSVTAAGDNAPPFTDSGGGSLIIPAGQTSGVITVRSTSTTTIDSGTGTIAVAITAVTVAPGGGTVGGSGSATVTITFRAFERFFAVSVNDTTPDEGDRVTFTVTLSGTVPVTAATVDWTITGNAADYSGSDSGSLSFNALGERTITITITDDDLIEGNAETITFTLSNAAGGGGTGSGITTATVMVTIQDDDAIAVTIRGPDNINEESTATYTVDLGGRVLTPTDVALTTGGTAPDADFSLSVSTVTVAANERAATFTVTTTDGGGEGSESRTLILTATVGGEMGSRSVTITEDDPAARATRVEAPLVSVAQSVGQLASAAVGRRLSFVGGSAVNVGGVGVANAPQESLGAWAANPFEREQTFTNGANISAQELLEQSSFALTIAGSGVNLWGSGGRVSADGEVDGVSYDGDSTAWHLGADTVWNDGLLGIALARTDGETDFTADGVKSKLKTDLTSVHPYATRNWGDVKVWGTFGYGTGDAELVETNTFKSDLSVLSLAGGLTMNAGRNLTFTADAHWNRAELDGGSGGGRTLPKVSADTMRINIAAQIAANFTAELRPFATLAIRRDLGDGDTGGAADYGGGVEWNSQQFQARLETRNQIQGSGANEDHLSFTLRHTGTGGVAPYARWNLNTATAGARVQRGRLSLGMEVGVADNAMEFKNLLSGEVRF